jgi:fatty acid desaturase
LGRQSILRPEAGRRLPHARGRIGTAPKRCRRGKRNNLTNWKHLTRIYLVIAAAVTGGVWVIESARAGELSWWWALPATLVAIAVIGASQHQFGGAIHEGTHYMLFANRKLNELASDWLAAFPVLTTTYHFRLHHLAHHQFVNDPERDPDTSQLRESDHCSTFRSRMSRSSDRC